MELQLKTCKTALLTAISDNYFHPWILTNNKNCKLIYSKFYFSVAARFSVFDLEMRPSISAIVDFCLDSNAYSPAEVLTELTVSCSYLMFLFASPISSLICLILTSLPDWILSTERSFWSLKYLERACLTWLNNFTIMVKLLDSSSWYTMWSWMIYWAVKVVVCWFSTTIFLLTLNYHSTWAWPCASISKILKELP